VGSGAEREVDSDRSQGEVVLVAGRGSRGAAVTGAGLADRHMAQALACACLGRPTRGFELAAAHPGGVAAWTECTRPPCSSLRRNNAEVQMEEPGNASPAEPDTS
jgi:hypothetical protein